MSVERKDDESIVIKSNNGVTAISRITGNSDKEREKKFKQWVEDCTKLVNPKPHTFKETEQYFLNHCDVTPLALDDRRMKHFKSNIIINFYKDKLEHQPPVFSFDMTDEEIEKWQMENDSMREEALNASPVRFGLNMRGYCLPHTERNKALYEEIKRESEKYAVKHSLEASAVRHQDICFFFEETTEHIQSTGGGNGLIQQMIVFRGVSQKDIDERSPQFLGYISTLRDMGMLTDF